MGHGLLPKNTSHKQAHEIPMRLRRTKTRMNIGKLLDQRRLQLIYSSF